MDVERDGDGPGSERQELVLAAAEGRLDDEQRARLERWRSTDPDIDREIGQLRDVMDMLGRAGPGWDESVMGTAPGPGVLEAALARIDGDPAEADREQHAGHHARIGPAEPLDDRPQEPGRRRVLLGLAAAGLVATGAVGNDVLRRVRPQTPTGPPGTLGALEPISMTGTPAGAGIDAALIPHTWGTETVLVVDGAEPGAAYELVLVATDGSSIASGGFLGTAGPLDCEMNAAILREDVAQVLITTANGAVWGSAQLPGV